MGSHGRVRPRGHLVANHRRGGSTGLAVAAIFAAMVATTALVLSIVFVVGG